MIGVKPMFWAFVAMAGAIPLLLSSCRENAVGIQNPNLAPIISEAQIEGLKTELRLGTFAGFTKDESDTLPKRIPAGDSATRSIFESEQVDAWAVISGFPKGVQATIIVNASQLRAGIPRDWPVYSTAKINTCCVGAWDGKTRLQLGIPFWNDPESLPFSMTYEMTIQGIVVLKDSITIE